MNDMGEKAKILPIVAYGDLVLRKVAEPIERDYEGLTTLIENMFATMYAAPGVGLAAPQVGLSIRLLVIDASPYGEDEGQEELKNFRKVMINPQILEESGEEWAFEEGCLSVPGIREDVVRKNDIRISYLDEHFIEREETYNDIEGRIIMHEYDHLEGVLFPDRLNPLKRRLLKRKLNDIAIGNVDVKYPMRFPRRKKRRK